MSLSESQLYQIKKAKARKTRVVVAAIKRELGQTSAITNRIVKARMSKELRLAFGITRLEDLPEQDFEKALAAIKNYRFQHCEKYFG